MENILKVKFSNGNIRYIIKIGINSIVMIPSIYRLYSSNECSAICAGYSMAKHVFKFNGEEPEIEEINVYEAFRESIRISPIIRITNEFSETAKRTGFKPWHHVIILGNTAYGIIWDTRELDVIANIQDINFSDCTIVKTDNGKSITYNPERFTQLQLLDFIAKTKANISDEDFSKIKWE